ncbi:MAG: AAA family ATPase [Nostoc sp. ChiQUE01a]|nr:AAA family ATPase [Nostoc sp. ChiQUE01a]
MFRKIKIERWRQFELVDIEFHPSLTVLTGANGSGKTTILNILSKHYGWNTLFISTPKRESTGLLKFFTDIWNSLLNDQVDKNINEIIIGEIEYQNGQKAELLVNNNVGSVYEVYFRNQNLINGFHVPSHRPVYLYKEVTSIPTIPKTKEAAFADHSNEIINKYQGGYSQKTANSVIKETLISLAVFGAGNNFVVANPDALNTFNGYQEVLRKVLPKKLGFKKIIIETPEVLLDTESGLFSLDAVSGGIASIIDLCWQIYMYSGSKLMEKCTVTIDEPENHLHPEMQKSLLTDLVKAFPNCQFIISTHSPFIVTSSPDSSVYALHYNEENRVTSSSLNMLDKAGSANDILRDVLGLDNTLPIWVESRIQEITQKYLTGEVTSEKLSKLKEEMSSLGLGHLFPTTANQVFKGRS